MDLTPKMLNKAKKTNIKYQNRISYKEFKLEDLEWRNEFKNINAVTCSLSIHHLNLKEKEKLFIDIYKILNSGGAFIIADLIKPSNDFSKNCC